jgi:hypothetical protein
MNEQNRPERVRIFLSPHNNRLIGAYSPFAKHIHVICDSTNSSFTVELPQLGSNEDQEFIFHNIPNGNSITITGRSINFGDTSCVVISGDTAIFVDGLRCNTWLLL